MLLGLAGNPVRHSRSPDLFSRFMAEAGIQGEYRLFELGRAEEIPELFREHRALVGLNVTIPFKRAVVPLLNELEPAVTATGSANVVVQSPEGLKGYNTDVVGFDRTLKRFTAEARRGVLVLGSGGSAQSVAYVLSRHGFPFRIISRRPGPQVITYEDLTKEIVEDAGLVVNTTPCGMAGMTDALPPFPCHYIGRHQALIDLVYNPPLTPLMRAFRHQGARAVNGLEMLRIQAEEAWEIFLKAYREKTY
ncbi:MAG: shikimate dehydrogenase [Flavobacteriales bacterium]|nr:shikimate dehydrogenase [Flavobacteriales bacterium]MCX7767977.1 shikimate dehydrogenase [Flavobacteriales bacterium]MDW8409182.1 shikimate dehydrogenase [Flavobacteriales bacterium]